jgi:hypothetical protein
MRMFLVVSVAAASVFLGAAAAPVPLISYRAQYDINLAPGGTSREIVGMRGRMVTEFRDACDGYSETNRMMADMTNADETTRRTDFTSRTFESNDGSRFDFTINDVVVGIGAQRFEGRAQTAASGGNATFTTPAGTTVTLPKGTLFPTEFTERLIAAARRGDTSFSSTVFHGDDVKELMVATAFIGAEATANDEEVAGIPVMRGIHSWPMVISYHKVGSEDAEPAYEMSFRGYENGVATGMRMRYPSFSVESRIVKLEVLERSCDRSAPRPEGKS